MNHLTRQQFDAFVMDCLPEEITDEVRRHVAACPQCADRLTEEAELEELLHEAGLTPTLALAPSAAVRAASYRTSRRLRVAMQTAAALIVVASGVWALATRRSGHRETPRDPVQLMRGDEMPGLEVRVPPGPGYDLITPRYYARDGWRTGTAGDTRFTGIQ